MDVRIKKIVKDKLELIDTPLDQFSSSPDENYWIEIKTDDRSPLLSFFEKAELEPQLINQIYEPKFNSRASIYQKAIVLNLPVPHSKEDMSTDFLTILSSSNILITIIPKDNESLTGLDEEIKQNPFAVDFDLFYIVYLLANRVLQNGMSIATRNRKLILRYQNEIEEKADKEFQNKILELKKGIGQISDIVEDQYYIMAFMPKYHWNAEIKTEIISNEMKNVLSGYEYLEKRFERQEDKLEILYNQYQVMLQEKVNKRLNTLTIVNAIFVPLTLISGIYGMNFLNMPELDNTNAYFVVLGVMAFIVIVELLFFWKNGWFD